MFLILGARDYLDAQEMTVALQTRLKEIIESADGCRVMGIGLEGGLAPYIDPAEYPLPEVRLWVMMKQAIEECGALDYTMAQAQENSDRAKHALDAIEASEFKQALQFIADYAVERNY